MIVKILKPVPMIDHVMDPGEFLDTDMLVKKLIDTGRAEAVTDTPANADAKPDTAVPEADTTAKPKATRRKAANAE